MNRIVNPADGISDEMPRSDFAGIAKGYLEGRNEIHVHVLTWNGSEYCALFYNADVLKEQVSRYGLDFSPGFEAAPSASIESPLIIASHQMQVSMFVDDIQSVELPEKPPLMRVNTGVWLLTFNDCFDNWLYTD